MKSPSLEDRFTGCLVGLMIGDALGGFFEGQEYDSMTRTYPSRQALMEALPRTPWHYTDDTQMAIGVAEALLQDGEIIESTLCDTFASNYESYRGYGHGTIVILEALREGQDHKPWTRELFPGGSYGNGAAMRVAPVGLMFHEDLDRVWLQARLSALPTHIHPLGIEGAQLVATAVALCLRQQQLDKMDFHEELRRRVETKEFRRKLDLAEEADTRDAVRQLGNGIAAHESAVTAIACAMLSPDSYVDVIANAILFGGDTDTIAAMAGAIAGARLGVDAIPATLLQSVEDQAKGRRYVAELGRQLHVAALNRENLK